MKTLRVILTTLLVAIAMTACNGNKPNNKLLDPNAMVMINVENGKTTRANNPDLPDNPKHLSPHDLVAQAENMLRDNHGYENMPLWLGGKIEEGEPLAVEGKRKVGEYQYKLIDEAKFVFWGDFIIDAFDPNNPKLVDEFFTSTNVRFVDKEGTIIGYIPQRIFKEGWVKVKEAFDAKDYEKVYRLFQEVYTAFPCTPEEYEALKAKGMN